VVCILKCVLNACPPMLPYPPHCTYTHLIVRTSSCCTRAAALRANRGTSSRASASASTARHASWRAQTPAITVGGIDVREATNSAASSPHPSTAVGRLGAGQAPILLAPHSRCSIDTAASHSLRRRAERVQREGRQASQVQREGGQASQVEGGAGIVGGATASRRSSSAILALAVNYAAKRPCANGRACAPVRTRCSAMSRRRA